MNQLLPLTQTNYIIIEDFLERNKEYKHITCVKVPNYDKVYDYIETTMTREKFRQKFSELVEELPFKKELHSVNKNFQMF